MRPLRTARRRAILQEDYLRYKVLVLAESRYTVQRARAAIGDARFMLFMCMEDDEIVRIFAREPSFYEFSAVVVATTVKKRQSASPVSIIC